MRFLGYLDFCAYAGKQSGKLSLRPVYVRLGRYIFITLMAQGFARYKSFIKPL